MLAPHHSHLATIGHILCYLKGTLRHKLFFPTRTSISLIGSSDVNWADYINIHRSITNWNMFLSDTLIYWKNK